MTQTATDSAAVKALLQWYLEAGVDEAIADVPQDRFVEHARAQAARTVAREAASTRGGTGLSDGPVPSRPPARGPLTKPQPPAEVSDQAAVKDAVAQAGRAETLEALRAALEGFDGCALKKTASSLCFTDGNPKARVLLVGEAPGAEEDRQGLPFVGASGKLLDRMLASIGLDRTRAFISNTVFWRPPGNRTPTTQEMAICMPFLERLIELVDPRFLVTLGGPAAKSVLAESAGVSKLRGRWFSYSTPRLPRPIPATALYHPAYLLRSPAQKRDTWRDLLALKKRLETEAE